MGMSGLVVGRLRAAVRLGKWATVRPFTLASPIGWLSGSTSDPLPLGASDVNDRTSELYTYLDPARRLLWLYRSFLLFIRTTLLAALALLVVYVLRLVGIQLSPTWDVAVVGAIGAWGMLLILRQRLRYFDVARVVDRHHDLHAQLGTAVELVQRHASGRLVRPQIRTATERVRSLRAREMIGFHWPSRDFQALTATVVVLVGLNLVNSLGLVAPGVPSAVPGAEVAAEAGLIDPASADWTELDATQMAELQGMMQDPSEMHDLVDELNQLLQSEAITPEEYAARLAEVEAELRARAEASARAQAALSELADTLRDASATREVVDALNRGDYQGASEALSQLGQQADQLSPQAREQLAEALREAAERTAQVSPELSEQARQTAEALEQGSSQGAQEALQQLAEAVNQTSQAIAPQSELGATLDQLQEAGMPSEQMGEPGGEALAEGIGGAEGETGGMPGEQDPVLGGGEQSGGAGEMDQPRASAGGGVGAGRERPGTGSAQALGIDAAGQTLRLQGKPSTSGSAQRNVGPEDTPLTNSSDGTLSVTAESGNARSTEQVNAYGEHNYVPFELRSVVQNFFSGGERR